MPMVTPDRRINKWEIKVSPDTIKEHFANQKSNMRVYFSRAAEYFYEKEMRTKQVLDGQGVLPSLYPMYYNFTREIARKIIYVGLGGGTLLDEVSIIKAKWLTRGLDATILDMIIREVFGTQTPPTGP